MVYYPYVAAYEAMAMPLNLMAHFGAVNAKALRALPQLDVVESALRHAEAAYTMIERATRTFAKPRFDLPDTQIDDETIAVTEETILAKPFGNLVHFVRDTNRHDPKVLLIAPMSGHYATLLRGTVKTLLPDHDVYVTDWHSARGIPPSAGSFDFDDYVRYCQDFMHHLGPETHVVAVCQPAVPALAAIALMAEDDDPAQPLSMTLMAGPIDPGASETEVTRFALNYPLQWFKDHMIESVPFGSAGFTRKVYPGFRQISSFMMLQPERHIEAHRDMFNHIRHGQDAEAKKKTDFYDEYLAGADMTAEFYLDTIERVFQRRDLPKGALTVGGRTVDPAFIRQTALMTVEGGKDDICGVGQTGAAHALCPNIPADRRLQHVEAEAGHYGIFDGSKFRTGIAPRLAAFIRQTGAQAGLLYAPAATRENTATPGKPQNSAAHKDFPYKIKGFEAA